MLKSEDKAKRYPHDNDDFFKKKKHYHGSKIKLQFYREAHTDFMRTDSLLQYSACSYSMNFIGQDFTLIYNFRGQLIFSFMFPGFYVSKRMDVKGNFSLQK